MTENDATTSRMIFSSERVREKWRKISMRQNADHSPLKLGAEVHRQRTEESLENQDCNLNPAGPGENPKELILEPRCRSDLFCYYCKCVKDPEVFPLIIRKKRNSRLTRR